MLTACSFSASTADPSGGCFGHLAVTSSELKLGAAAAAGCQAPAVGLKQLLQPAESAHLRHDRWTASSALQLEGSCNT